MTPAGASGGGASDRPRALPPRASGQRLAKATMRSPSRTTATGSRAVLAVEEAEGEALLARLLVARARSRRWRAARRDRRGPRRSGRRRILLYLAQHLAHPLPAPPSREKSSSGTRASSPIFSRAGRGRDRSGDLGAAPRRTPASRRGGRTARGTPDQLLLLVVGADRIAHRDPAPPFHAVHEKGASARREEERLVAEEREIGLAGARRGDRGGPLELVVGRRVGSAGAGRSRR